MNAVKVAGESKIDAPKIFSGIEGTQESYTCGSLLARLVERGINKPSNIILVGV